MRIRLSPDWCRRVGGPLGVDFEEGLELQSKTHFNYP